MRDSPSASPVRWAPRTILINVTFEIAAALLALLTLLTVLRLRSLAADRRRLDAAATDRERYYRAILGHTNDGVAVLGADAAVRYTNPALTRALGADEGAVRCLLDHLHPDDRAAARAATSDAAAGTVTSCELRPAATGDEDRWFEAVFSPLPTTGAGQVLLVLHDVTERKDFEAELRHQALHDSLTGLPNRLLLSDRVEHSLARGRRRQSPPALLFVDLDHFKTVNDSLGHDAGDQLLRAVADRLRSAVREEDTVVRLGGDEFAVLVESPGDLGGAAVVAERLLQILRPPFDLSGGRVVTSASVGIALGGPTTRAPELLRDADLAMYRAKASGRNGYAVFLPEMHEKAAERLMLETDMIRALEQDEFRLLYQPIIDLATGSIEGIEALVRWDHPTLGRLTPDRFIPIAEESGLIVPLGRWVLGEATRAAMTLPPDLCVSVNVSARQLTSDGLVTDVRSTLASSRLDPGRLVLEITESMLMADIRATTARLDQLKALGVRVAVDDFGTGYSSLAYLQQFPVDILKIDRSFIARMVGNPEAAALVRALIEMGQALRLQTVAEGVEEKDQLAMLQAEHCDLGQGYLYSRPIELAELARFIGAVYSPNT